MRANAYAASVDRMTVITVAATHSIMMFTNDERIESGTSPLPVSRVA
jgi:hypothetical protein